MVHARASLRAPGRPAAPGGHGALRRAALPLELQLPRRRLAPRGAGRGGRPPRPRGPGPHRPRRLLRRGPLRRGRPGGWGCPPCSAPSSPSGATAARRCGERRPRRRHRRAHLVVLARDPRGLRPAGPGHQRRPSWRGEKGAPRATLAASADRRPGAPLADRGHWLVLTGCRKGAVPAALSTPTARPRPAGELRRLVDAFGARPRGRRAVGPRRPARLGPQRRPGRASPCGPGVDLVATNNVHYATPAAAPPGHGPGRGAGPAQPRRARRLAARPAPAPTCARAPSRPAASPATRGWSSARPSWAGRAPSTCTWWPPTCRRSRAPTGSTRWPTCAGSPRRAPPAATAPARHAGGPSAARRLGPDRPRARRHRAARLPRLLPHRVGHRRVLPPGRTSTARGGVAPPTRRSASPSASPRPTPCASACCSSGSSRPSATARPTSTSTSSATGARRSSSTSTSATGATTPPRWPTSSPTGPRRRCATWPRRSGYATGQQDAWSPSRSTAWGDVAVPSARRQRRRPADGRHPRRRARAGRRRSSTSPATSASTPAAWCCATGRWSRCARSSGPAWRTARCCSGTRTTAPRPAW